MTEYLGHILIKVAIFGALGVTYNLIMGYAGIISLAHAVFFGVGSYTTALLELRLGVPFVPALLSSIVAAGAVSAGFMVLIGRVRGDYLVIVTLGLQLVFISVLTNLREFTGGSPGLTGIPRPELFGFQFDSMPSYVALTVILCSAAIGLSFWIARSPFGRSLKAVREDEMGAQSLGKNIFKYKVIAFAVGGAIAGIPGSLYASYQQFINPYSFNLFESIMIMVIVIVGGVGNLWGSVLGAVILVSLPEILSFIPITSGFTAQIRELTFGLALLLMVFFRPQGFFGEYSFGVVKTAKRSDEPRELRISLVEYRQSQDRQLAEDRTRSSRPTIAQPILQVSDVFKWFGGILAVNGLSFSLPPGKVIGIIGPNGAGKSTLFNLICGNTRADSGSVLFKDRNITSYTPHAIARLGIGRSFQDLRLFRQLSVLDNVIVALQLPQEDENASALFNPRTYRQNRRHRELALHLLEGAGLADSKNQLAKDLSYGEQKLLVLVRLLATKSELFLLDELAAGLDPASIEALGLFIRKLPEIGVSVCLVEHSLDFVRLTVDTILFLDRGCLIAEGSVEEIVQDHKLAEIYFGAV